jgi:hypothetical protein
MMIFGGGRKNESAVVCPNHTSMMYGKDLVMLLMVLVSIINVFRSPEEDCYGWVSSVDIQPPF